MCNQLTERKNGLPYFTFGVYPWQRTNYKGEILPVHCTTCKRPVATFTLHTGTENLFRFPFCEDCAVIIKKSILKYWEGKERNCYGYVNVAKLVYAED